MEKKKLSSINFPGGTDFLKFLGKSTVHGEWSSKPQIIESVTSFAAAVTVANEYGPGSMHDVVFASATIQLACDTTPDAGTIYLGFNYLRHYPAAQKMLWHYLTGNGDEVEVDTELVFSQDNKLKTFVLNKIQKELIAGKNAGTVNVPQPAYGNPEWKNAFGSINVHWKKSNDEMELWIEDTYKWHPGEQRVTQCVHQAMERAKKYGAKDFHYTGSKWIIRPNKNLAPFTPP